MCVWSSQSVQGVLYVGCLELLWSFRALSEVPTQLAVCYDDDRQPSVQFWDLRNCQSPFKATRAVKFCEMTSQLK